MSDLFERVTGDQDIIKKLLANVPGFKGYLEKRNRKMSDKLLREAVANRFEQLWQRISGLQRELISSGDIGLIDDLEAAAIKLRQFIDRIRTASYGYSPFFAAVKINSEDLARVYEYDSAMFDLADDVSRAIDHVEASLGTEGLPAAIRNLTTTAQSCLDAFNKRNEVMINFQAGGAES